MEVGLHINEIQLPLFSRMEYVIEFINNHPLSKGKLAIKLTAIHTAKIVYGKAIREDQISIFAEQLFFRHSRIEVSNLKSSEHHYNDNFYYSIGRNPITKIIEKNNIPFDLFETIFFHISRIEEINLPFAEYVGKKNEYESQLFSIKHKIYHKPVIDDLITLLIELVTGQAVKEERKIGLSHDVDVLQKFGHPFIIFKKIGGHFLNQKSWKGFPLLLRQYWNYLIKGKDPFDLFDWMMAERHLELKEIYFLSGGSHTWDTPYSFASKEFNHILKLAEERNYQIGIHPSYESWNNVHIIEAEKARLQQVVHEPITHSRQHFLNFDIQNTPQLLLKAGIFKDSSIGYSRHVGFRCGTGFDYYLYDFEKELKSELLESPLAFMDMSCLYEANFNSAKFVDCFNSFFDQNKWNTQINCNFHNSFFDEAALRNIPIKQLYSQLIHG